MASGIRRQMDVTLLNLPMVFILLALFSNCTWKRFGKIKLRARSSFLCGFYDTIGTGPLTDYLREV
jgi:hypothetical protein